MTRVYEQRPDIERERDLELENIEPFELRRIIREYRHEVGRTLGIMGMHKDFADMMGRLNGEYLLKIVAAARESVDTRDTGPQQSWIIWYEDPNRATEVFSGYGAEQSARKRYEIAQMSWDCLLFREIDRSETPEERLLRLFDLAERWPEIRAAIRNEMPK